MDVLIGLDDIPNSIEHLPKLAQLCFKSRVLSEERGGFYKELFFVIIHF